MEPLGRDYVLHEEIGRGAWAVVRRATSRSGGPALAAKLLLPRFAADRRIRDLLLREEAALRDLDHPSIVGLRDLVVERGQVALVMELVDGPDLRRYLTARGGALPAGEVRAIGAQVAAGLAAAHAHGVVHLDLKPENVLIAGSGEVKVADFGVSALLCDAESTAPGGTPGYLAPEVLAGRPPTAAADVYALGVLLNELAGGSLPEAHECLSADPRDRPSTRSIAATLRGGGPVEASPAAAGNLTRLRPSAGRPAPPATPVSAPGRPRWRRPMAYAAASVLVIAAAYAAVTADTAAGDEEPAGSPAPEAVSIVAEQAERYDDGVYPDEPETDYAGDLDGWGITLYLAVRAGKAIGFVCDGNNSIWLLGNAWEGKFSLSGERRASVKGSFTATRASGEFSMDGGSMSFSISTVRKPAGLYRAVSRTGKNGKASFSAVWIVFTPNHQEGAWIDHVGNVDSPPNLALPGLTASVSGETVTATAIDIDSRIGF